MHTPQGDGAAPVFYRRNDERRRRRDFHAHYQVEDKKKLIEEEDSHNPITDDQVVKDFNQKDGIKLSPNGEANTATR